MNREERIYAVITGDIVRSARLPDNVLARLNECIRGISKLLEKKSPEAFVRGFTTFRGDSFQALLELPEEAPEVALRFLVALKKAFEKQRIDARLVIGIGSVKILPRRLASEGHGEAYTLSGRGLDSLGAGDRLAMVFPGSKRSEVSDTICSMLGGMSQHWTPRQLEVMELAMDGLTQEEIAKRLRIDQAAVARHLTKASWKSVERAVRLLKSEIEERVGADTVHS